MSGYRHSGLTREDYEDRETLRAALEVIERRWSSEMTTAWVLREGIREIEGGE